jgi:tRNA A22 N-methylase
MTIMLTAEEIKKSIVLLPEKEYKKLRKWFSERDWSEWDRKIMRDSENGSLDFLAEEAMLEKKKGMLGEL